MKEVKNNLPTFIHWFSWTISLAASAFFILFLVGEGIPDLIKGKGKELSFFLPWMIMAITGSILSLFKPKLGAILMLAGGVVMVVTIAIQSGMAEFGMMLVYGIPYILPGLFFLLVKNSGK